MNRGREDDVVRCPIQLRDEPGLFLDYLDRKLEPELMRKLDVHAEVCPLCREAVSAQKVVWDALDAWTPEPVSMDFGQRLMLRIDGAEARRSVWERIYRFFATPLPGLALRPVMPVAAACVLLVVVGLYQIPGMREVEPVAEMQVDIEQVETTLADIDMLKQLSSSAPAEESAQGSNL